MHPAPPPLVYSRRVRRTPFTSRVTQGGMQMATVYNHTVLPSTFRGLEADYDHLCEHVQVWDVGCERQVQIQGPDAKRLVQWMTPRDLSLAKPDRCFYVPLCDENGFLINDPIALWVAPDTWWLSIADSDVFLWAKGLAYAGGLDVTLCDPDVWPIAVQGPKSYELLARIFGDAIRELPFFHFRFFPFQGHRFLVARSGWSKQGGFEIYIDDPQVGQALWDVLFEIGADLNVGHGCPNQIERIESGLLSFGNDMDYATSPLQCGLDKYCHLDRDLDSISLPALRRQREQGLSWRLMGLRSSQPTQLFGWDSPVYLGDQVCGSLRSEVLHHRWNEWLGMASIDESAINAKQPLSIFGITVTLHELPFSRPPATPV